LEDRLDEALLYYQEYHGDATVRTFLKHEITLDDIENEYIELPDDIIFVKKIFPINSQFSSGRNMFDIKYQMMLNDMASIIKFSGELAYYEQMQQYLSLLDSKLNGQPQIEFSRRQGRLYIHGNFDDGDLQEGNFIIIEVYSKLDPEEWEKIWSDMWLIEYTTALFKQQWGQNLIKFEGMQLPGGVTINGRQLYDDATSEIERLREKIRLDHEIPTDFFVG